MALFRSKNQDLTQGNLIPQLIAFAVPLIIGNMIQVLFNMADQAVVAQFGSEFDVASIGATSSLTHLSLNLLAGLSAGVAVVISRIIGAKDLEGAKKAVATTLWFSLFLGTGLSLLFIPLARPLLLLTNCPSECLRDSTIYLSIFYISCPFSAVCNFGGAVLRSAGDSQRPTVYLTLGGALNVVLNVILCLVLPDKVAAVAIATVAANVLTAILTVRRLATVDAEYRFDPRHVQIYGTYLGKLLRYGIPSAIASMTYPVANMQIQSAVNSFGPSAVAGNAVCSTVDGLLQSICTAFQQTTSTFVGQNFGADNRKRANQSLLWGSLLGFALGSVGAGIVVLARPLTYLIFLPKDIVARDYYTSRMLFVTVWYGIAVVNNCLSSYIQSYGYATFVMIENICTTVVFRTIWMQIVYPMTPTFNTIMACYVISWTFTLTLRLIISLFLRRKFRTRAIRKL